jgi:hypothetical protein
MMCKVWRTMGMRNIDEPKRRSRCVEAICMSPKELSQEGIGKICLKERLKPFKVKGGKKKYNNTINKTICSDFCRDKDQHKM